MKHNSTENNTNMSNFSERFRKIRKGMGLSQKEFAEKLGFTTNTAISRIERGEMELSIKSLRNLAELSKEVDLHYLITGQPSRLTIVLKPFFVRYLAEGKKEIADLEMEKSALRLRILQGDGGDLFRLEEVNAKIKDYEEIIQQFKTTINKFLEPVGEAVE